MQQQVLEQNPSAPLAVYAVWFNMLPDDSRGRWDPNLLPGSRVTSLWDEQRTAGRYFANGRGVQYGAVYDVWLLYAQDAQWGSMPLNRGEPIINTLGALTASVRPLLKSS